MECPKCQYENREGAKFCRKCGARLELTCPKCGHPYLVHGKGALRGRLKCPECGHKQPLEMEEAEATE